MNIINNLRSDCDYVWSICKEAQEIGCESQTSTKGVILPTHANRSRDRSSKPHPKHSDDNMKHFGICVEDFVTEKYECRLIFSLSEAKVRSQMLLL